MVLLTPALGLGLVIGLSSAFGGDPAAGPVLAGSDSQQARGLLEELFPARSGDPVDVVVRADAVTSTEAQGWVEALLGQLEGSPTLRMWKIRTCGPTRSRPRDAATPTPAPAPASS